MIMKDSKDVEIAVVTPVTEMNPDEVKEYYEENPPEEGETFAVSILNPTSGKEVETLKGGSFKTKKGSGEELYPGKEKKHLGPTLALDVKLPTIKDGEGNTGLGGLATLDDLVLPNGKISNIGIGIDTSKLSDELKREYKEYTVEEYVEKFCEDGTSVPSDLSKFNMYKTKMQVNIWVYTSLGNFVDYFSFGQEMNDPEYTNDAGKLKMFFEMKPDKDGYVRAENGKMMRTRMALSRRITASFMRRAPICTRWKRQSVRLCVARSWTKLCCTTSPMPSARATRSSLTTNS